MHAYAHLEARRCSARCHRHVWRQRESAHIAGGVGSGGGGHGGCDGAQRSDGAQREVGPM